MAFPYPFIWFRGKVRWQYFDDEGHLTDTFFVEAGGDLCGISVPKGQWYSLECLESGSVIFEAKDGVWEPLEAEM